MRRDAIPDFSKELRDDPPRAKTPLADLEVENLVIPDEEPPLGDAPLSSSTVVPVALAPPKKGKKIGFLLPLLLLGVGGYYIFRFNSQSEVATSNNSTLRPVTPIVGSAGAKSARLKALWKQGAAAKHRGDIAEAKRAWQAGLKLDPNNKGFREALAKLPRQ